MLLVKVAAAALNQTPLDWEGNKRNIVAAIEQARSEGVSILCLPELCITGYGCEDAFLAPGTQSMALDVLEEVLPATEDLVVCVGLPLLFNKGAFNCSALVISGKIAGFVAKRALAGDGIHYEPRWFKPWPAGRHAWLNIQGRAYPIGDIHFDVGGIKIGFEICEDAWIAQRRGAELSLDAVDVILNPSASHFAFGKYEIRRRLVLEGSRAFGVSYLYANQLGNEAGRAIYDGDALIATGGAVVARTRRFRYVDVDLISAVVDVHLTRSRHSWLASFQPKVSTEPGECIVVSHDFPKVAPQPARRPVPEPWESSAHAKEEEFTRAVSLALFDYMRKSRAAGFVVSASGGADSAGVSVLVALMARFAEGELGIEGLARKLAHIKDLAGVRPGRELAFRLLTTVYQSTRNSSEITRNAARRVAEAIGARHLELDVDAIAQSYVAIVEKALGRKLGWQEDDIALQNIQARARAPSVWMIANLTGALLASTSNRSEAAVGYATMDGDTSGGLSPIAGIDKAFLRRWLAWLETIGPEGLGPIPELRAVTSQVPTAELRPLEATQTDEADLMPYELLDAIERGAIRDKRAPLEVYRVMRSEFPQYEPQQLLAWVERFYRLWSRNQWKRERYAPSFHVDDANLDPKTWCRFPILSGGFERELAELRAAVEAGEV
jgi:NAD+ synthase (glutamine-hydrolysing)